MAKILRQNVGGVDFTVAGCALTGVCPTAAADYVKQITLSDGDVIEDGMMMVVTFANGNTAGNAPNTKTIYSSDQVNYYEDAQLTVPFTLAPAGCYEIEYTGTANAYTYTDYPVFQVGTVSGPVCDYRGHITSGDLWEAGDSVQCMLKEGKFLLLGGSGDELAQPVDTVQTGNLHAVTSNAVAESLKWTLLATLNVNESVQIPTCNEILLTHEDNSGNIYSCNFVYGNAGFFATGGLSTDDEVPYVTVNSENVLTFSRGSSSPMKVYIR